MFVIVVLLFEFGPVGHYDVSSLLASTFAPAGPLDNIPEASTSTAAAAVPTPPPAPTGWLGHELQVARDALSVLTADPEKPTVANVKSEASPIPDAQSTDYGWFRNEYRWARDQSKAITDLATTSSSALVETKQKEQPVLSSPPPRDPEPSLSDQIQSTLHLMTTYVTWALENLAALSVAAVDILRTEVEVELKYWRRLAEDMYKSPQVRDAVNTAIDGAKSGAEFSQQAINQAFTRARRWHGHVCANDRCSAARLGRDASFAAAHARRGASAALSQAKRGATVALTKFQRGPLAEAQKRGYETLVKARRGLDSAIIVANRAVDTAASEAHARVYKQKEGRADVKRCCKGGRKGPQCCAHQKSTCGRSTGSSGCGGGCGGGRSSASRKNHCKQQSRKGGRFSGLVGGSGRGAAVKAAHVSKTRRL